MYRTNLTAYWTAQPGELKADECIEDIFAGGDGWARSDDSSHASRMRDTPTESERRGNVDMGSRLKPPNARNNSGGGYGQTQESTPRTKSAQYTARHHNTSSGGGVNGRSSLEQHTNSLKAEAAATNERDTDEVDEFDLRDDLRSWKISEPVK